MNGVVIEICVDDAKGLADAVAGGADRIELCSSLAVGGLTPAPGLMALAGHCPVPVRAMIRPRDGGFRYDRQDRLAMLGDVDAAREAGLHGIVIGALTANGELDVPLLEELIDRAEGMDVTLHRVVDLLTDPVTAVDVAVRLGIASILTSGRAATAIEGSAVIRRMCEHAGNAIEILAGSGIRSTNAAALVAATGVHAIHASASRPRQGSREEIDLGLLSATARTTDRAEVAALRDALEPAVTRSLASPRPVAAAGRDPERTAMYAEAREAPDAVARLLDRNRATLDRIAGRLRSTPPSYIVTCARGSSDHAATYGKYLFEQRTGTTVASAAPSIASIYGTPLRATGALCIAISQSGRSPDLLAAAGAYRAAGAYVVALVNDEQAPLANLADEVLPLCAGTERSVAATKSYIASLAAQAALVATWTGDDALERRLAALPDVLARAFDADWSDAVSTLRYARNLFVLGRGPGLAIAQEAALKFKETCALHAEAFSAAEVRHGPMAIVRRGFPVLGFATSDTSGDDVRAVATQLAERGALTLLADGSGGGRLPAIAGDPVLEPLSMIQSFYRFANALAVARGIDPDAPPHLKKVTETR